MKNKIFKKEIFKSQHGITLIALVITIIVLLILAGVSLNLVMGNQGILQQATKAVEKNNEAKEQEEIELKEAEWSAEYYRKKYVENDTTLPDTVEEYVEQKMGKNSNSELYGKVVNYTAPNNAPVKWKVFHMDSENIYLIADDYISFDYAPESENYTLYKNSTDYKLSFNSLIISFLFRT